MSTARSRRVLLFVSLAASLTLACKRERREPAPPPAHASIVGAPAPMTQYLGAYPFDTQSVVEVTPDESRAFVADGAAISILDLNDLSGAPPSPRVVARVELPHASPRSLLYYRHPVSGQRWLFVAGGSLGLWRISLCDEVMALPPDDPTPCTCQPAGCDPWERIRIDLVEDPATFRRKRCVDLAIVEGNPTSGGAPLLCALYAARGDVALPFGPTEVRAYRLETDGAVDPHAAPCFLPATGPIAATAAGSAIAADPADPKVVYVALGSAWIRRVDLTGAALSAVAWGPTPSDCPLPACGAGESMRDLAIVETAHGGSVVYAALDYGRILEVRIAPVPRSRTFAIATPDGTGKYLGRIEAIARGEEVLLAVGMSAKAGRLADTNHISTIGGWTDFHQRSGMLDPNGAPSQSPIVLANKEMRVYRRKVGATAELTHLGTLPVHGAEWGSLVLRESSPTLHRVYSSPELVRHDVRRAFGPTPPVVQPATSLAYSSAGVSATDGTMSLANPRVTYFGFDGASQMLLASPEGRFSAVADANLCGGPPGPDVPDCIGDRFPNPFVYASVQAVANWLDPDPQFEWFVAGGPTWRRVTPGGVPPCSLSPLDDCTPSDPCGIGPFYWRNNRAPDPDQLPDVGWFVVRMRPGGIAGNPPSAAGSQMKWWQLHAPAGGSEKVEGHDYISSEADPRHVFSGSVDLGPRFVHCVRTGSDRGLKVFDGQDLVAKAVGTCSGDSPGHGEQLPTPDLVECETHVEIGTTEGCVIYVGFAGTQASSPRNLFNNKTKVFSILAPDQTPRWIVAATQGWIASGPHSTQPPTCLWDDHFGRAIVAFYDVTNPVVAPWPAAAATPMAPIRVGRSAAQGHAWAVEAKTYGSGDTYAFVADFAGKLLVFRVNHGDLFDPTKSPYASGDTLAPSAVYEFPGDVADAMPANCIDLELDGDLLYCALGRAGIGVLDVGNPLDPVLVDLVDTPGLVEGIEKRTINGKDQLVIGDTRCGMRVYERVGE